MAKLDLSRGDIIEEGLALAGRPDLTSNARLWLNMFLEEYYFTQDSEWLVKLGSGLAVTNGMSMPTDYRATKSAVIIASNGSKAILNTINNAAEYDALRVGYDSTNTGTPTTMYIDSQQRKFYFLPAPTSGHTLDLQYFYVPEIGSAADNSDDNDAPVWGLPSYILVDFVKAAAAEYQDDSRQDSMRELVQRKIAAAKLNNRDSRAGHTRIQMGNRFRKRF